MDEIERLIEERRGDEEFIGRLQRRYGVERDLYDRLADPSEWGGAYDIELPLGEVKGTLTISEGYDMGDEW